MHRATVGAVLLLEDARLKGVLSERDVALGLARDGPTLLARPAHRYACANRPVVTPDDTTDTVMAAMTAVRARHAPVVEDRRVVGLISLGDLARSRLASLPSSITQVA